MKKTAALLALAAAFACTHGFGENITSSRDIKDFDVIKISCYAVVNLKQGDSESLTIEGDKDAVNGLVVDNSGGILKIKRKDDDLSFFEKLFESSTYSREQVTISISAKNLKKISNSGSIELNILTPLKCENLYLDCSGRIKVKDTNMISINDKLTIDVSGSSEVNLADVAAREVGFKASGSSDVVISNITTKTIGIDTSGSFDLKIAKGTADLTEIDTSGSTDCDLSGVECKDVKVSTSGSGTVRIYPTESLKVSSSGSNRVYYKGNPKSINNDSSGSSRITRIDN